MAIDSFVIAILNMGGRSLLLWVLAVNEIIHVEFILEEFSNVVTEDVIIDITSNNDVIPSCQSCLCFLLQVLHECLAWIPVVIDGLKVRLVLVPD